MGLKGVQSVVEAVKIVVGIVHRSVQGFTGKLPVYRTVHARTGDGMERSYITESGDACRMTRLLGRGPICGGDRRGELRRWEEDPFTGIVESLLLEIGIV